METHQIISDIPFLWVEKKIDGKNQIFNTDIWRKFDYGIELKKTNIINTQYKTNSYFNYLKSELLSFELCFYWFYPSSIFLFVSWHAHITTKEPFKNRKLENMRVPCNWPFTKVTIQVNFQSFLDSKPCILKLEWHVLYTMLLFFIILYSLVSPILVCKFWFYNILIHNSKVKDWRNRFYESDIDQSLKPGIYLQ